MVVSIAQPAYLPWLGYFDRLARSDLHVVLDRVQLERRGFSHRTRVAAAAGPCWLTVPTVRRGEFHTAIADVRLAPDGPWRRKHWQTLRHAYVGCPHFAALGAPLEALYGREWTHLAPLLEASTNLLLRSLGVATPVVRATELTASGRKGDLILELCREVGAHRYLSGPYGRTYLDLAAFAAAGIEVEFHRYLHPVYAQRRGGEFTSHLSVVDLLFNHGPRSLSIITGRAHGDEPDPGSSGAP